jgi:hypothetical protein
LGSGRLFALERDYPRLFRFLERNSMDVELLKRCEVSGETVVERKLFRVGKHLSKLLESTNWKDKAAEALFDVPRRNPQEKLRAFMERVREVLLRVRWLKSVSTNPWRRFKIRYREYIEATPFFLSCLISILLLITYGIPIDPHTGGPLGGGHYSTFVHEDETGVREDYPWAKDTSDPDGIGRAYISVLRASDLSDKFRLRLTTRWESQAEWEYWPAAKQLIWAVGLLHMWVTMVNSFSYIVQDYPVIFTNTLRKVALQKEGAFGEVATTSLRKQMMFDEDFLDSDYSNPEMAAVGQFDIHLMWLVLKSLFPLV